MAVTPLSDTSRSPLAGRLFLGLFFSAFLVIGLGFFIPLFGIPAIRMIQARGWAPVSCRILESSVAAKYSSEGDATYRVDVRYAYEFDGLTLVGTRYNFLPGSSSGDAQFAAVAGLPAGSTHTCWVDPEDAMQVVLSRSPTSDMFFAFFPLIFVFLGAGGVYAAVAGGGTRGVARSLSGLPQGVPHARLMVTGEQPYPAPSESRTRRLSRQVATVLRPTKSRRGRFVGLVLFALLWNVVVFTIVRQEAALESVDSGHVSLLPFVLVGAFLAVGAVREGLKLGNPTPEITLDTASPSLGDTVSVGWSIDGRASALRSLRIDLVGHEEARYRRGTETVTAVEVFATLPLVRVDAPIDPAGGHVTLELPTDTMHSFESTNNKVVWSLRVRGEIPNWPDSDDSLPLAVAPGRP